MTQGPICSYQWNASVHRDWTVVQHLALFPPCSLQGGLWWAGQVLRSCLGGVAIQSSHLLLPESPYSDVRWHNALQEPGRRLWLGAYTIISKSTWRSSLVAQQVKDLVLSLLWLWLLLWYRFHPWSRETQHALGVAKKKSRWKNYMLWNQCVKGTPHQAKIHDYCQWLGDGGGEAVGEGGGQAGRKCRIRDWEIWKCSFAIICIRNMWKFLGQGLNLNQSSDTTESLSTRPPGNSSPTLLFYMLMLTFVSFVVTPPAKGAAKAPTYSARAGPFPTLASFLFYQFVPGTTSLYLCSPFIFICHTSISTSY